MKPCSKLLLGLLLLSISTLSSASAADKVRTVSDIPGLSNLVLQRTLSATIYKHLVVSPVEAWVAVRGQLSGDHIFGARVIHSEMNGVYDKYALQLARNWTLSGQLENGKTDYDHTGGAQSPYFSDRRWDDGGFVSLF